MSNKIPKEDIVVVKRKVLEEKIGDLPQGFFDENIGDICGAIAECYEIKPRQQVEEDKTYKQIIPYMVLARDNGMYVYKRGEQQGEVRLHQKWSIGIGGHMNGAQPSSRNLSDKRIAFYELMYNNAERELQEEMHIPHTIPYSVWGFVNDDSNDVGSVHFGIVLLSNVDDIPYQAIRAKESGIVQGVFMMTSEIVENIMMLETWSQMIVRVADKLSPPS